jgi:hypothetical protein
MAPSLLFTPPATSHLAPTSRPKHPSCTSLATEDILPFEPHTTTLAFLVCICSHRRINLQIYVFPTFASPRFGKPGPLFHVTAASSYHRAQHVHRH